MNTYSIIIPCLNDAHRLDKHIGDFMFMANAMGWEVIVVDDGSYLSSAGMLYWMHVKYGFVLLQHEFNHGKWAAIRTGVEYARGTHVVIADADFSVDPLHTIRVYERTCQHWDVMLGDRNAQAKGIPLYRRIMGLVFSSCANMVIGAPFDLVMDSQCPSKVIPRAYFPTMMEEMGWAGDVELILLLYRARRAASYARIKVCSVMYVNDLQSNIHPVRDSLRMFVALFRIRQRWC